jgi:serine/threonine protein kinase
MADVIPFPPGITKDSIIGWGLVGVVARYDTHRIIKFASTSSNRRFIEIETRIYKRLNDGGGHDGLLKYHGCFGDGIILGYACNNSLRLYMAQQEGRCIPLSLRLRWAEQLVAALSFIHSKGILHGDISCNNAFLDEEFNLKLGDFAGSSIDGEPVLVCYETSYEHPEMTDISIKSELFAVGSALYEIMTGSRPYEGQSDFAIKAAYRRGNFPDLADLDALAYVITNCWQRRYNCCDNALKDIRAKGNYFIHSNRDIILICCFLLAGNSNSYCTRLLHSFSFMIPSVWPRPALSLAIILLGFPIYRLLGFGRLSLQWRR